MPKKYYAVREGRVPGVYETWADCKAQTDGWSGAVFKSFASRAEAVAFVTGEVTSSTAKAVPLPRQGEGSVCARGTVSASSTAVAYVDGSYNVRTGEFGCGGIIFLGGEKHEFSRKFDDRELAVMRNVAGEIKGAEYVMNYCAENNISAVDIYYDYEGIAAWAEGRWKTNKDGTREYKRLFDSLKNDVAVRFVKVKGHSGDKYNDRADRLAKDAVGNE